MIRLGSIEQCQVSNCEVPCVRFIVLGERQGSAHRDMAHIHKFVLGPGMKCGCYMVRV